MKTFLPVFVLSLLASSALADTTELQSAMKKATKSVVIPHARSIAMFERGEAIVVTDNPRYVVKGELFDMWANKPVKSPLELSQSAKVIPLKNLKLDTNNLFEMNMRESNAKTLTVFIDPTQPDAAEQLNILATYASAFHLKVIFTTLHDTQETFSKLLRFACVVQDKQPREVLVAMSRNTAFDSAQFCQQESVIKTFAYTKFLNIRKLPTLIASNDVYSEAMPVPLVGWLATNME